MVNVAKYARLNLIGVGRVDFSLSEWKRPTSKVNELGYILTTRVIMTKRLAVKKFYLARGVGN